MEEASQNQQNMDPLTIKVEEVEKKDETEKKPVKSDPLSLLSFRPSYMTSTPKDVAKTDANTDSNAESPRPGNSGSPNNRIFTSLNIFSNMPMNIDEKPTCIDQCIYTKKFLIGLRPSSSNTPTETVVTLMKELEIYLEDDTISDSKRPLVRGKWDPVLNKRPSNPKDKLEQFRSDIQLLLNKLTIEKFISISEKLTDIVQKIDDFTLMAEAVSLVHTTVIIEYRFVSMYADLCKLISPKCKSIVNPENGKTVTFRQILLNKCQKMFELSLVPVSITDHPDLEKRNKDNHNALGNILFLGELFNRNLVPPAVIEGILALLLQKINDGLTLEPEMGKLQTEGCSEKLCRLFCSVGKNLELNYKTKPNVDKLINEIKALTRNKHLPMRLQFMLSDIIDLKQNGWVPRKHIIGPDFQTQPLISLPIAGEGTHGKPTLSISGSGSKPSVNTPISNPASNSINSNNAQSTAHASSTTSTSISSSINTNTDASTKIVVSRKIIGESTVVKPQKVLEKNIEDMIEDYLSNSSKITPAIEFLCSLQNGGLQQLVYHSIIYALEKNTLERLQILELLVKCSQLGALPSDSFEKGIKSVINILSELHAHYPIAYVYVGQVLSETTSKSCISLDNIIDGVNMIEFSKLNNKGPTFH